MTNLPAQPGQELNGFLVLLRDKGSVYMNGSPFLDTIELSRLDNLIGEYNAHGASASWQRSACSALVVARSRATSGILVLSESEKKQLDELLVGHNPSEGFASAATTKTASRTIAKRRRQPGNWKNRAIVGAVVALVAAIGISVAVGIASTQHAAPVVSQPIPISEEQPVSRSNLQSALKLFGPWESIAPTTQAPNTAHPAVLMLKSDGGTLASTEWRIPFDEDVWTVQNNPFISSMSVDGNVVRIESTNQSTFLVHVDQAFMSERIPDQVYLVDAAGHVWHTSQAEATSLRQELPVQGR